MAENWQSTIAETSSFSDAAAMISRKMMAISIIADASLPILRILKKLHSKSLPACDSSNDDHVEEVDDHSLEGQCVICLCNISNGEKYRVLSACKHGFHFDCIDVWLQNNSTCPLCRCPAPYTSSKLQLNNEQKFLYLYDVILSCFLSFMDHFCTWFVDPLGLDTACEDSYHSLP